jgi:hypothetical protein
VVCSGEEEQMQSRGVVDQSVNRTKDIITFPAKK